MLFRLAPLFGDGGPLALMSQMDGATPERQFTLYVALGLTRQAQGLRLLSGAPVPTSSVARVGRSLGLLALGEGSGTSTVARALATSSLTSRRRVSRALSEMHRGRPTNLLKSVLNDEDFDVRLRAASALAAVGSGAGRSALRLLARSVEGPQRGRATEALVKYDPRGARQLLKRLTGRARCLVLSREVVRSRSARKRLGSLLSSGSVDRAGALAALAHFEDAAKISTLAESAVEEGGSAAAAQLAMARLLAGDEAARLPESGGYDAVGAIDVLACYSGAGPRRSRVEETRAQVIANALWRWRVAGLDAAAFVRGLDALAVIRPAAALQVARRRVAGSGVGAGVATALGIMGAHSGPEDLPLLLAAAGSQPETEPKAEALIAAWRVCAR